MKSKHTDDASSGTSNSDFNQPNSKRQPPMSHSASSSANPEGCAYEVFLSFRGSDTRKGFTDHLYISLTSAGIRAFRDNEDLRVGEEIGGDLLEAINQSKIFIPIFSKDYASSKWCLKEAAHMVNCRISGNHLVLPIFYDVTPHQVKHQSETYEEAFRRHSDRYDENTVQEWRNALAKIGALKGWELQNVADGHEGELVKMVVSEVWRELKKARLVVKDSIIRLEDSIEEIMGMLQIGSSDVRVVGIYGMGGIGKTTLAKIIYNQLLEQFECSSFLEGIRAKGLEKLQTQLVNDILRPKYPQPEFAHVDDGMNVLKQRFRDKKVLILLDDVDNKEEIDALATDLDWFAEGSRIIITTRDKDVLDVSGVKETYELRAMHSDEALHLFSMHAFKGDLQAVDYADLSKKIVATTGGLPLALEIIGSLLSTKKSREIWEGTLEKLQNCPHKGVQDKLRISYDALEFEQQQIFLDIACFFIGTDKRIAVYMWKHIGFYAEVEVNVLLQRSLVKIRDDNELWMHDQLRDLGREIVRNENIKEPGERSRIWLSKDVRSVLEIQEDERATNKIEAIQFDGIKSEDSLFTRERPINLPNIRFLRLASDEFASRIRCRSKLSWLEWHYGKIMECSLSFGNLVILDLSKSNVTNDWSGWSSMQLGINLKVLILESCQNLSKTPDLSKFRKLERLSFEGCRRLSKVGPSIRELKSLIFLNFRNCRSLEELPKELNDLQSLVELYIDGYGGRLPNLGGLKKLELLSAKQCKRLTHIPQFIGCLTSLVEISLDDSGVCMLPDSFKTLAKLERLSLRGCPLEKLPDSIGQLTSLEKLFLAGSEIQALPESIGNLTNLQVLLVAGTKILNLPSTLGKLEKLEVIDASNCQSLQGEISVDLWKLHCLKALKLDRTNIATLPANIDKISHLQTLRLNQCDMLQTLPQLPTSLQYLTVTCKPIRTFPNLSIHKNLLELKLRGCIALERIPGLGNLVLLKILEVLGCQNLTELNGLEELECLRELEIFGCDSLEKLSGPLKSKQLKKLLVNRCKSLQSIPNLSANKMLQRLSFKGCEKLRMVEGVGELELLEDLAIDDCKAIESLPNLSKLAKLRRLELSGCAKLRELQGLEELKSLTRVDITSCTSLYYYLVEWPCIPWEVDIADGHPIDLLPWKLFLSYRSQDVSCDDHAYVYCDWGAFTYEGEAREDWGAYRDEGEPSGVRLEAMNRSKIYVPILSEGYAFSFRCLQELVHIVECKKKGNRLIFPIFYDVSPNQVQEQSGSYGEAFEQHINCYEDKIVQKWRATLREVGALNGWELQHVVDERKPELVKEVLRDVLRETEEKYKDGIEVHVEEVMKMLEINANNVRKVGIHGTSGIGKTALAKGIYDQLKEAFAYHILLTSLQARGPEELQSQPLPNTLNGKQEEKNTERITALCLGEGTRSEGDCFSSKQFTSLPNLEFLQLNKANIVGDFDSLLSNLKYLRWHHCPNNLSVTNLCLKGLLVLEIIESDITDDWNGWSFIQMSVNLEVLILKSCGRVTKTPYLSTFPKLHTLIFDDCKSLNSIDSSIGELTELQMLSLKGCSGLEVLDVTTLQNVEDIEYLSLESCKSPKEQPSFILKFWGLRELDLSHTSIHRLPDSIGELNFLEVLNMCASNVEYLPSTVGNLRELQVIDVSHTSIHRLPDSIEGLDSLKVLNMSASNIEYLPRTIGKLVRLQVIDVSYCKNLNGEIILEPMILYSLSDFIMDGTDITLPPSIIGLLHLRRLNWAGCYRPEGINVLEDESDDGYGDESNDESVDE